MLGVEALLAGVQPGDLGLQGGEVALGALGADDGLLAGVAEPADLVVGRGGARAQGVDLAVQAGEPLAAVGGGADQARPPGAPPRPAASSAVRRPVTASSSAVRWVSTSAPMACSCSRTRPASASSVSGSRPDSVGSTSADAALRSRSAASDWVPRSRSRSPDSENQVS